MWVIKVASISACLRYTVIDITSGSNRCSNRFHCPSWSWKESSLLSCPFAIEHIESWWTNRNVSERICRYMRDPNRESMSWIRIRSIQNRKFYLDNLIKTYFIVFKRALNYNVVYSWEIWSLGRIKIHETMILISFTL